MTVINHSFYSGAGVKKVLWFPSSVAIATPASGPTRVQINAALDLASYALSTDDGFMETTNFTDFPLFARRGAAKVDVGSSFGNGIMTFGADKIGTVAKKDIRTLLTPDLSGHLFFMHGGDVPTSLSDLFSVSVGSVSASAPVTAVATVVVAFGIIAKFSNIPVPAV